MKGKKGKAQQSQNFDDDYEFLLEQAAKNKIIREQTKIENVEVVVEKKEELLNLPESPSISFPDKNFPVNEECDYNEHQIWRKADHDLQEVERIQYMNSIIPDLREGAEIHRRVRTWAMENIIKPGVLLYDMCGQIEDQFEDCQIINQFIEVWLSLVAVL